MFVGNVLCVSKSIPMVRKSRKGNFRTKETQSRLEKKLMKTDYSYIPRIVKLSKMNLNNDAYLDSFLFSPSHVHVPNDLL